MKTIERQIAASEFKAKCLKILDELDSEGIVITKRGNPIAKVTPLRAIDNSKLIGSMKRMIAIKGDIFSTGRKWHAKS
jgi:prevent-host-death family protein